MFWGLIMEPNKRYSQIVDKSFHLSMASLDASTAIGGLVQVMVCYDDRKYLLCTLQKDKIWQVPLDLNFEEGTKISFTCNGDCHVHLTGYLIQDDLDGLEDLDEDDEEDEEEEVPMLVDGKRKAKELKEKMNNSKRAKKMEEDENESGDNESDSEMGALGSDDSEDLSDDDDDDDDMDDSDDEDDEDDESDEEEEKLQVQLPKKEKQKQNKQKPEPHQNNQQQQNQSQNKDKKDKSKMMNGKQEKEQGPKQKKGKNDSTNDSKSDNSKVEQQQPKKKTVEGGVQVTDVKIGEGAPAKPGKFVSVYYVGRLKNGKKFDATKQGDGFKFRLGKGEVIKGWDVGVAGMKVGGKRLLSIPPNMAYGAKGSPPVIPPNSWLNFEVELKSIH